MARFVVDASVVVKWFLVEPHSTEARQLRDDYAADVIAVEAPSLLPYEVLNALRFADVYSAQELRGLAKTLDQFGIPLHDCEGALSEATADITASTELTVYDASYVALAQRLGVPLCSADEALLGGVGDIVEPMHIQEYRPRRD